MDIRIRKNPRLNFNSLKRKRFFCGKSKKNVSHNNNEFIDNENLLTSSEPTLSINANEDEMHQLPKNTKIEVENINFKGNRIVNMNYFLKTLKAISNHSQNVFDCNLNNINFIKEQSLGLNSKLFLKCNMCNLQFQIETCPNDENELPINYLAVSAATGVGIGYSGMEEIFGVLNIPYMGQSTYSRVQETFKEDIAAASVKAMYDAAMEARELSIQKGNLDKDGTPLLTVVTDGCYSKRTYGVNSNYSALSAAGTIVAHETGKVIWSEVANKYCGICKRHTKVEINTDDIPPHSCNLNYSGPSTGMEAHIILEGFKKSEELYQVRYNKMIADGDSSVYSAIKNARPYKQTHIHKIECKNHLLRNFRKGLKELILNTRFSLQDRIKIKKNHKRIIIATLSAIKYRRKMETDFDSKVKLLKNDLNNISSHVFGEHENCDEYYCKEEKHNENNEVPALKLTPAYIHLSRILGRLRQHGNSLIENYTSNIVEQYHSIVAKSIGGKRINFSTGQSYSSRCKFSVIQHNTQRGHYEFQKHVLNKSPQTVVKSVECKRLALNLKRKEALLARGPAKPKKLYFKQDAAYGENCQKPDLDNDELELEKTNFINTLKAQSLDREKIERLTCQQSDCGLWHEIRRNRLTASSFGVVCRVKDKKTYKNRVRDILYSSFTSKAIEYGKINESVAIEQLKKQINVDIIPCGIFIDSENPCLAASPDGLIVGEEGIVEIKCPMSAANLHPDEAIRQKKITFWKYNKKTEEITINKKHHYYYQVQGQLNISKKSFCLFCVWTGHMHPLKVERIEKDVDFFKNEMLQKLLFFFNNCMVPEIIDSRYNRNLPIREPKED